MKLLFSSLHARRSAGTIAALLWMVGTACLPGAVQAKPKEKPTPAPAAASPTPAPTPTPTATPMPTASNPATDANYSGEQQARYQNTARDAFVAQRSAKSQPFIDAYAAFDAAGGVSAKGLKSKEEIAARRDLLAKTIAANDAYLDFARNEEYIYRLELDKTPLVQGDVDSILQNFVTRANVASTIKLRETETAALKAGDDILAFLDKRFGLWSVGDTGNLKFKKPADVATINTLSKKYGGLVTELQQYQKEIQASAAAGASPSPSPGASPVGATPTGSLGAATAAPSLTPAPSVSATPAPAPSATAPPAVGGKK